jgi:large subunit ribosomal protein L21
VPPRHEAGTAKKPALRVLPRRAGSEHEDRTMFAVIKTGGKQYRVAADDRITVAKLEGEPGGTVTFEEVLMLSSDSGVDVGAPLVKGVTVSARLVEHTRGEKVIAFKKRRRQNSRRKRGHRQDYSVVRITGINAPGAEPQKSAAQSSPTEAAPAAASAE